jgi:hypothetical protein
MRHYWRAYIWPRRLWSLSGTRRRWRFRRWWRDTSTFRNTDSLRRCDRRSVGRRTPCPADGRTSVRLPSFSADTVRKRIQCRQVESILRRWSKAFSLHRRRCFDSRCRRRSADRDRGRIRKSCSTIESKPHLRTKQSIWILIKAASYLSCMFF